MKQTLKIISISCFLSFVFSSAVQAESATISNQGNVQVRVQYKTPNEPYRDMYLGVGETVDLPGGVEKVKLVREVGEAAQPPKKDVILHVTVTEGDEIRGALKWYGDKIFFKELTTGDAPPAIRQPADTTVKTPTAFQSVPTAQPGDTSWWPWFGLSSFWMILLFILLLILPLGLGLGRSFLRRGYDSQQTGFYPGTHPRFLFYSLIFGFILGMWAMIGFGFTREVDNVATFFARDLYMLPITLVTIVMGLFVAQPAVLVAETFPPAIFAMMLFLFIPAFWMVLFGLFALMVGRLRASAVYTVLFLMAILPIAILVLGFGGVTAYAGLGQNLGVVLYAGAFTSLLFIPILLLMMLQFVRPYGGFHAEKTVEKAVEKKPETTELPRLGNCPSLLMGVVIGLFFVVMLLVGWSQLSAVTTVPILSSIVTFFVGLPLILGITHIAWPAGLFFFWMMLIGLLVYGLTRSQRCNCAWTASFPALLILVFLISTFAMGEDLLATRGRMLPPTAGMGGFVTTPTLPPAGDITTSVERQTGTDASQKVVKFPIEGVDDPVRDGGPSETVLSDPFKKKAEDETPGSKDALTGTEKDIVDDLRDGGDGTIREGVISLPEGMIGESSERMKVDVDQLIDDLEKDLDDDLLSPQDEGDKKEDQAVSETETPVKETTGQEQLLQEHEKTPLQKKLEQLWKDAEKQLTEGAFGDEIGVNNNTSGNTGGVGRDIAVGGQPPIPQSGNNSSSSKNDNFMKMPGG